MNSDLTFLGTRFKKKEQDLPKHAPVFLLTVATVDDRIPAHGSQADTLVTPTPRIYTATKARPHNRSLQRNVFT